jgi:hypothetical protein
MRDLLRDPDLTPAVLADRVVLGAEQHDLVRLHGAITAALNLFPRSQAYAEVLAPSLERLDGDAWRLAREAMNAHLIDRRRPQTA